MRKCSKIFFDHVEQSCIKKIWNWLKNRSQIEKSSLKFQKNPINFPTRRMKKKTKLNALHVNTMYLCSLHSLPLWRHHNNVTIIEFLFIIAVVVVVAHSTSFLFKKHDWNKSRKTNKAKESRRRVAGWLQQQEVGCDLTQQRKKGEKDLQKVELL